MTDINISFSRALLREGKEEISKHFPQIRVIKDALVYHFGRNNWEFHGPENYYWHGRADNAYEARYKGWMAWLESKGLH